MAAPVCEPGGMSVPRTIHQLWKDAAVPDRYGAFCGTWRRHNPDWTWRLWTDADLLALVEARYPSLSPIFNGYEQAISRADLGRYLRARRLRRRLRRSRLRVP